MRGSHEAAVELAPDTKLNSRTPPSRASGRAAAPTALLRNQNAQRRRHLRVVPLPEFVSIEAGSTTMF